MTTTRRDLLTTALTAAGVSAAPALGRAKPRDHGHGHDHDHDHQAVPSDPALRAKALKPIGALRTESRSSWRTRRVFDARA